MKDKLLAASLTCISLSTLLNLAAPACLAAGSAENESATAASTEANSSASSTATAILTAEETQQVNDLIARIAGIDRTQRSLEREASDTADREKAMAYNRKTIQESEDKLYAIGPKTIPVLIETLNRSEQETSQAAERVLIKFGTPVVRPLIIAVAEQKLTAHHGKRAASDVMRKLGGTAVDPMKELLAGPADAYRISSMNMLTEMLPDRRHYHRYHSHHDNVEEGYVMSAELIATLCTALGDHNDAIRRAALETLGRVGPRNAAMLQSLYKTMKTDPDATVRRTCATALGDVGQLQSSEPSVRTVEVLEFALVSDEYEGTRMAAAKALGKMTNAPTAVRALVKGLSDPVQMVRDNCVGALQSFGPAAAPAVPELIKVLKAPNQRTAEEAARTLGRIGPAAAPALPAMLKLAVEGGQERSSMRYAITEACKSMGEKASPAVPYLTTMLKDPSNSSARYGIVEALGAIGPSASSAEPAMLEVAKTNSSLRQRVETALKRIKGEHATLEGLLPVSPTPRHRSPQQLAPTNTNTSNPAGDV
jgi:HEAT repeat protein